MSKSKTDKQKKPVVLPSLGFGKKQSIFSGGAIKAPGSFIPKPVRITQHKGG